MRITMLAAISSDGFIAASGNPDPRSWTSVEDANFLSSKVREFSLQVMGQTTYDVHQPAPSPSIRRVVLTHHPEKYIDKTIDGVLEFHDISPEKFVELFGDNDTCLLLGGSAVYTSFLDAGLVNENFLTIEPVMLHAGTSLLPPTKTIESYGFTVISEQQLNTSGTVLKHYVLKK